MTIEAMIPEWIEELRLLLGDCVRTDEETLRSHAIYPRHAEALPQAVVLATSTEQVSQALRFAHERGIPVTPRGAGVGYVGGPDPFLRPQMMTKSWGGTKAAGWSWPAPVVTERVGGRGNMEICPGGHVVLP